jgi:hypothetical protein
MQASPGFHLKTLDLSPYIGQTIRIHFVAKEDNGSMTSFVLDDFKIVTEWDRNGGRGAWLSLGEGFQIIIAPLGVTTRRQQATSLDFVNPSDFPTALFRIAAAAGYERFSPTSRQPENVGLLEGDGGSPDHRPRRKTQRELTSHWQTDGRASLCVKTGERLDRWASHGW